MKYLQLKKLSLALTAAIRKFKCMFATAPTPLPPPPNKKHIITENNVRQFGNNKYSLFTAKLLPVFAAAEMRLILQKGRQMVVCADLFLLRQRCKKEESTEPIKISLSLPLRTGPY